jgi:acyl-CoA synthetase (AMP-forming)/AMP-acid ligase II
VAAIPDAELGERVGAAVVLRADAPRAGALESELREHCRARLARFKAPEVVVVVDELPLTAVGKVDRRRITDLLVAARETHAARP